MTDKPSSSPLIVVISGPSGVGKDAIINEMKKTGQPYFFTVTATSRTQRPGEIDGVDYHFIEKSRCEQMIKNNQFLEWANVYGNLYGVPKEQVTRAFRQGKDAIIKVDVQGVATIKKLHPEAISIFIAPPSIEELKHRLQTRKTESGSALQLRIETAQKEMQESNSFDHIVTSHTGKIDEAVAEIESIITREKKRTKA